ncbi:MAG TPA: AAA family ATPase [Candidatus Methylomirabilis sp.]|nr:AAA family ATPase [Candidatus Methylomirabilis sp.]
MAEEFFTDSVSHILAELERIDLLVRLQVWRAQQIHQADPQFQGLYVSEQEVEGLLAQRVGMPRWAAEPAAISASDIQEAMARIAADIERRKAESIRRGIPLHLEELLHLFPLAPFERDILLICLAPELDLRYERLYAYLQDDVTKKRPSVDLVLNLLSPSAEAKLAHRRFFGGDATLRKHLLVSLFDDPSHVHPPLLGRYLKVDERVVDYLHGLQGPDGRIQPYCRRVLPRFELQDLLLPAETRGRLALMLQSLRPPGTVAPPGQPRRLVVYFQGDYGVGKQTIAEAICRELGLNLLTIDGERFLSGEASNFETALHLARREALFQRAALYWAGFDHLLAEDKRGFLGSFLQALEEHPGIIFLAGNTTWEPADALEGLPFVRIEIPRPAYAERVELWRRSLDGQTPAEDVQAVANKFRLSGGEIRDAAATARNLARWRDPTDGRTTLGDLSRACRLQSNRKLATLAQKITPHYRWEDIVLPGDRLQQLREICNSVKYRSLVYEVWGFTRKLALGKGVNILFAGPSGTGKTMAAEIMAGDLGLDLYKIDLSTVVSKYIGETEKNLSRIFAEAERSNAILFFDEADALFGKRSEVRDAHDRYANIEISYLLQKMEEYEGVVILATNLRKNMDDAFVRRMHFTVEFPFPSERDRRRIWEQIWPEALPRGADLDLGFMARQFEIAGGNIRNVALGASFLAAADGELVSMTHLIQATRREYQKMGKVMVEGEFGEYAGHRRRDTPQP